jgi:nitroimidazol reductase NimA-like FMN-containing flavoprotein (pyridoxamine 5'-phosphate oxidase superfamily)
MTATSSSAPGASAPGAEGSSGPAPRRSLSRKGCLALLAAGGHGRVAASMRAIPVIIPVSFTLVGDEVVFKHGYGEALTPAVAGSVIAFETDHLGSDGRTEWEVHVTGVATTLSKRTEACGFRLSSQIVTGWQAGV